MTDDDTDDRDDSDTPPADDNYERSNEPRSVADPVKDLLEGLDFTQKDDAWWAEYYKRVEALETKRAADAERTRMRQRAEKLVSRGRFPSLCVDIAMESSIDTPAMRFARLVRHMPSRIIVFAGGVGVGKTVAACWYALKNDDHNPGFIRAGELERRGRYDKKLDDWLKEITSLVIDDLGVEVRDSKRIFASLLDEIVDSFHSRKQKLVLTTNLLPKVTDEMLAEAKRDDREPEPQFVERYGERIRSRVRQIGQWADCGTYDLRRPSVAQA